TQVAQQDPLTGLMGRRHSMAVLDKEIARAERNERPLSVLICRVQGLGKLNDMYGLHATDAILAAFTREAENVLPRGHHGGRWTGIEFIYILPGADHDAAEACAAALQEHFET